MAYEMIGAIKNFIGLDASKPASGFPSGSTYWAYDTGINYESPNGTTWVAKGIVSTLKSTTINLQQAANTYDLFTGTTQDILLTRLVFALPAVNVSDDINITSISIQTNDATPQVIISAVSGAKVNLTSSAQLSWVGAILLTATKKIQLTIAGGAADAATVCKVTTEYIPITAGGYLA